MDYINQIILGNALNVLPKLPAESVNCVTCSPPYWSLRDYGVDPIIWDEDKNCKHIWGNKIVIKSYGNVGTHPNVGNQKIDAMKGNENKGQFCQKCGAWRGNLGLEPTFELYIEHLCQVFDEIKRILRKDGTCWVNIGTTFCGGHPGGSIHTGITRRYTKEIIPQQTKEGRPAGKMKGYQEKCDFMIPERFAIEMINRGWIKRRTIIWHKPNCMPSSIKDDFTINFEYLYFFVKNNETLFWTNEKTLECVSKQPLGTKGIENKDWKWKLCPTCHGEGTIIGKALKKGAAPIVIGPGIINKNTKAFRICPRCKGSKKVKYSLWSGHDYWFEQQFEPHLSYTPKILKKQNKETEYKKQPFGENAQPQGRSHFLVGKKLHDYYRERGISEYNPQGRNKRCVWIIPTQPFPEAHFAVYPEGLIEIPIKAGCPEFVCKKCGKARVKIYETNNPSREYMEKDERTMASIGFGSRQPVKSLHRNKGGVYSSAKYIGLTDCGCNAGFESGIVLDPFIGSGTTAKVALKQRKRFTGIEIKKEYIEMSKRGIAKVQRNLF